MLQIINMIQKPQSLVLVLLSLWSTLAFSEAKNEKLFKGKDTKTCSVDAPLGNMAFMEIGKIDAKDRANLIKETDKNGMTFARNVLSVSLAKKCTVKTFNNVLKKFKACITSAFYRSPVMSLEVPDPKTHDTLQKLVSDLRSTNCFNTVVIVYDLQPAGSKD